VSEATAPLIEVGIVLSAGGDAVAPRFHSIMLFRFCETPL
jgi:hypothetical protein